MKNPVDGAGPSTAGRRQPPAVVPFRGVLELERRCTYNFEALQLRRIHRVEGNGATIVCSGRVPAFVVRDISVTIRNCTFVAASRSDAEEREEEESWESAALVAENASLKLDGCLFRNLSRVLSFRNCLFDLSDLCIWGCRFVGCAICIEVDGFRTFLQILNNTFHDCQVGCVLLTAVYSLRGNYFFNCRCGLLHVDRGPQTFPAPVGAFTDNVCVMVGSSWGDKLNWEGEEVELEAVVFDNENGLPPTLTGCTFVNCCPYLKNFSPDLRVHLGGCTLVNDPEVRVGPLREGRVTVGASTTLGPVSSFSV